MPSFTLILAELLTCIALSDSSSCSFAPYSLSTFQIICNHSVIYVFKIYKETEYLLHKVVFLFYFMLLSNRRLLRGRNFFTRWYFSTVINIERMWSTPETTLNIPYSHQSPSSLSQSQSYQILSQLHSANLYPCNFCIHLSHPSPCKWGQSQV